LQIGQIGEVLSTLRPAGKVCFGDDIVDAVSDGEFVEKGRQVQIQQIHGNHVVVSEVKNA
jgi:membrane-bound serine protease (ClpP class)